MRPGESQTVKREICFYQPINFNISYQFHAHTHTHTHTTPTSLEDKPMGAEPQSRVSVTHVEEAVIPEKRIARSGRAFSPKGNKNKSSHPQGQPGTCPRQRDQVFAWEEAHAEPEALGYGLPSENRNSTANATNWEEAATPMSQQLVAWPHPKRDGCSGQTPPCRAASSGLGRL